MANYMKEIAEMLGVRLNENFEVVQNTGVKLFRLEKTGLYTFAVEDDLDATWGKDLNLNDYNLRRLLTGELTVAKPPFKPKYGEEYWYIVWNNEDIFVNEDKWLNCSADYLRYKLGNCFHTQESAYTNRFSFYKKITGEEWSND